MFKENNSKKQKRKLEIKELAQIATEKINENKILLETLSFYQLQIKIIKKILDKKSKLNTRNDNNYNESTNITTNSNICSNTNEKKEESNLIAAIKNDFLSYYQQLKREVDNLKEMNTKLFQKYETNNNIIFDESSLCKLDLNKNRIDIFILDYELKQKNDIIRKLNESIINSKRHSIFREMKRETETSRNSGTNYLNTDNLYLQRDLQMECKSYNKCINRIKKKQKNYKKFKDEVLYFEEIIQYFEKENNKNNNNKSKNSIFHKKKDNKHKSFFSFSKKKSLSNKGKNDNNNIFNSTKLDEIDKKYDIGDDSINIKEENKNNNQDQTYLPNMEQFNNFFYSSDNIKLPSQIKRREKDKDRKKQVKQKFNFLTVDELFDLDNVEGEKEVIIQEELHSDDEIIFEKKIKNKNRVNTCYLSDIKKQVPRLYLNQIEFNKKKVMNEADLYSLQRREYNKQNIDENIRTMKKKIKIMKKRININKEKLNALINFDKKAKEQYNVLKPIKVLSSTKDYDISFMKKEFYNYKSNKDNKNDIITEVDEKNYATQANNNNIDFDDNSYDEDNKYNLDNDDDDDVDDYSDKMRNRKEKIKKDNKNNNIIIEDDFEDKKNKKGKKLIQYNDDNKAKSK